MMQAASSRPLSDKQAVGVAPNLGKTEVQITTHVYMVTQLLSIHLIEETTCFGTVVIATELSVLDHEFEQRVAKQNTNNRLIFFSLVIGCGIY